MNDPDIIEKMKTWVQDHPGLFGKIVSIAFLSFGILVIIGALRNWDWLFKPDASYHNKWTIGQISRYLGRTPARMIGLAGGILLVIVGYLWTYWSFTRR